MSASAFRLAVGRFEPWRHLLVGPAWCGAMAPATLVAATLLASIFATQYSHIDDSICQLGAQDRPHAWIMSLGFVVYASFAVAFSLQIRRSLDSGWGRAASKALLLHAAYALLLAFVQANPRISGIEHNAEGAVHIFLARGAMLLIGLAMLATARHYWRAGSDASAAYTMTAIVVGALLAVAYVSQVAVEIDGVFERIMLLLVAGWFVALTLRLRRDALRSAGDADQPVADLAA